MSPSRKFVRSTLEFFEDFVRIVGMAALLIPVVHLLPRAWALRTADALAVVLLLMPFPGLVAVRRMSRAFGTPPGSSLKLAFRWIARPLRDFVVLRRIVTNLEDPSSWEIVEENADGVRSLREAGKSYVVATGHFVRPGYLGLISPQIGPGRNIEASGTSPKGQSLRAVRTRLHYRHLLRAIEMCWTPRCEMVWVGSDPASALKLVRQLREPGTALIVHVDARWSRTSPSAYSRPFAGSTESTFSIGAIQLAKMAGCAVVPCAYAWEDGKAVLHWGDPIFPIDDPRTAMDEVLALLEAAVAQRPDEYVLDIGKGRRWNKQAACWEAM